MIKFALMITNLLFGMGFAFTAVGQPGPLQIFFLSQALLLGWRRTVIAAITPILSDAPIIALVLLVLTSLPGWVLSIIQVGGGLFILYLAVGAWRTFVTRKDLGTEVAAASIPLTTTRQLLGKAVTINLLNPAPFIFWGTFLGPRLLEAWAIHPTHGLAFLIGFYGTFVLGLALIIIVFGKTGQISPRVNRVMGGIAAAALFGFGLYQLFIGLSKLI